MSHCLTARPLFPAALCLMSWALLSAPADAGSFRVVGSIVRNVGNSSVSTTLDSYDAAAIVANGVGREVQFDYTAGAPDFTYKVTSAALADIGGLGGHTFVEIENKSPAFFGELRLLASSTAKGKYDDVMIDGPAGFVTTSLNLSLDGSMIVANPSLFIGSTAGANVSVEVRINDKPVGFGLFSMSQESLNFARIDQALGMLEDWRAFGTVATPSFMVQTNVPFSVELTLTTGVSAQGFGIDPFQIASNSGFLSTLTFARDRPVFSLASEYTATSTDAGITNNAFAPVPEPSRFALMGIGLFLAAACATRQSRHRAGRKDEATEI